MLRAQDLHIGVELFAAEAERPVDFSRKSDRRGTGRSHDHARSYGLRTVAIMRLAAITLGAGNEVGRVAGMRNIV